MYEDEDEAESVRSSSRVDEDRELAERLEKEHADAAKRASHLEGLAASLRRKQMMCEAGLSALQDSKECGDDVPAREPYAGRC